MTRHLLAFSFALLVAGCPPMEEPVSPSPTIIDPPDTDLCDDMCAHIGPEGLKCEEGEDVYNDDLPGDKDVPNQSCADFCRELQEQKVMVNPKCILLTPTCEEIEDYRAKEPDTCVPPE